MAGGPDNAFSAASFDELIGGDFIKTLTDKSCKEGIDKILETTDLNFDLLSTDVMSRYGKYNKETGKYELNEGLKGEEILAMYVELMANPQIYYSTVGKGFWKNTKNQILNLLEGSGLKRYTEKSIAELDNVQALDILARLAQEMTFNKSGGQKIRVAQNLDQLRDPLLTTRTVEGPGRPRQGEYKIFDLEDIAQFSLQKLFKQDFL